MARLTIIHYVDNLVWFPSVAHFAAASSVEILHFFARREAVVVGELVPAGVAIYCELTHVYACFDWGKAEYRLLRSWLLVKLEERRRRRNDVL